MMQRQLVVIAGPETGRTFRVEDGQTLTMGRGQASDTQINDPHVSRVHCRVQVDGGKMLLADVGSSSGTLIDGVPVTERELQPGDVFQIGDTRIRYQLGDPLEEATMGGERMFGRPKPAPDVTPLKDLVGQSLAHYRLEAILATGVSGMVFKAQDTQHNRVVAVKVLTPDPTHNEEQKERFVRAMKTMLPVKHPHIVQLYNAGKNGPYCWAAMEFIDGESMTEVIRRIGVEGMLDWRETFRVAVHIGRALQEAYAHKIIHRNVTPANILRRKDDRVCLLGDLLLAKALEGTLAKQVTRPGQLIGDVPYMSPERTRDQAGVDHRSDLYGLGATLYALLTGHPPFESKSLPDLVRLVREAPPRPPREFQLSVNELFQDVVMKLIAKRPEDRFQDSTQLMRELQRIGNYTHVDVDQVH